MNPTDRTIISVFGASRTEPGSAAYDDGVECGRLLAEAGFPVATGGYRGIMEAVCRGAVEAGGPTVGVTVPTVFPQRSGPNRWVEHEIPADDLVHRIGLLTSLAGGFVALPGSLGTLAELVMAWNLAYVAPFANASFGPVAAVGDVWKQMVPDLADQFDTNGDLIMIASDVAHAVDYLAGKLG